MQKYPKQVVGLVYGFFEFVYRQIIEIFIAFGEFVEGSADVWAHPELFQLDEDLKPVKVAGVPPDYFSKTGQLWGNPLYNWEVMAENVISVFQ